MPSLPLLFLLLAAFLLVITGIVFWNTHSPVRLDDVDDTYVGRFSEGAFTGKKLNAAGVTLVKEWIETKTYPSVSVVNILWHQIWYNAVTNGYDLTLWIEPPTYSPERHLYGIYQRGTMVFLRIEYQGKNRVLAASFTVEALERTLEPFVIDP